jgi:[ribosomal protein S18]-alanine N-acetyltransferase
MTIALSVVRGDAPDIARIMPVMRAAFDPEFGEAWNAAQCASALSMPGAWLTLALDDAEVAGFALARRMFEETELLLLAVDPLHQSRGVGRALIEHVQTEIISRGGGNIFVEVRATNAARQFYDRLGFVQTGLRKNYYRGVSGLYNDAVTLTKRTN